MPLRRRCLHPYHNSSTIKRNVHDSDDDSEDTNNDSEDMDYRNDDEHVVSGSNTTVEASA